MKFTTKGLYDILVDIYEEHGDLWSDKHFTYNNIVTHTILLDKMYGERKMCDDSDHPKPPTGYGMCFLPRFAENKIISNTASIQLTSLYPSMILDCEFNYTHFPELIDTLLQLRRELKSSLRFNGYGGVDDMIQLWIKRFINYSYGMIYNDSPLRILNGGDVSGMARKLVSNVIKICMDSGCDVYYIDTDEIYISSPEDSKVLHSRIISILPQYVSLDISYFRNSVFYHRKDHVHNFEHSRGRRFKHHSKSVDGMKNEMLNYLNDKV